MPIITPKASDRADIIAFLSTLTGSAAGAPATAESQMATGDPGDWRHAAPGMRHRIVLADLPAPFATESSGNGPKVVSKPADAVLSVPPGFTVKVFASDSEGPAPPADGAERRPLRRGDAGGRIHILRSEDGADAPTVDQVYADGLDGPFGIAFYPNDGARSGSTWRITTPSSASPMRAATSRRGGAQTVVPHLCDGSGGHSTRDVAFSTDGSRMFISVGLGLQQTLRRAW